MGLWPYQVVQDQESILPVSSIKITPATPIPDFLFCYGVQGFHYHGATVGVKWHIIIKALILYGTFIASTHRLHKYTNHEHIVLSSNSSLLLSHIKVLNVLL